LSDELNKFSAVRRDEMAGRGCQVLSLLGFIRRSCLLRLLSLPRLFPKIHAGQENRLQMPMGEENPET
jgi:hypothetical protein